MGSVTEVKTHPGYHALSDPVLCDSRPWEPWNRACGLGYAGQAT